MPVQLRPFRESDLPRLVAIANAVEPDDPTTEAMARHADTTWDDRRHYRLRLTAEDEHGHILGFGSIRHSAHHFHPHKYRLDLRVDPAQQRRGAGSALYERLLTALRERAAIAVRATAKESRPAGVAFLLHRGFLERQREWESRLAVPAFDFAPLAEAEPRVAAQGIAITTLQAELANHPDATRQAYELYLACERNVPDVDPVTDVSYDYFLAHNVEAPNALPDAWFLAKDGERYVGVSDLFGSPADPALLYQGLTGVLRPYRGRGIAMALKLHGIRYARRHGIQTIVTGNGSTNAAMLRINDALGFQRQPPWIEFLKSLP